MIPFSSYLFLKIYLVPITCLFLGLGTKYHTLGALTLRVMDTTLHLALSFFNYTCFTLGSELEEFF